MFEFSDLVIIVVFIVMLSIASVALIATLVSNQQRLKVYRKMRREAEEYQKELKRVAESKNLFELLIKQPESMNELNETNKQLRVLLGKIPLNNVKLDSVNMLLFGLINDRITSNNRGMQDRLDKIEDLN